MVEITVPTAMQRLSSVVRTNPSQEYKSPIVGRLNFRDVTNVPIGLLRNGELYDHNHTGSPCPCK